MMERGNVLIVGTKNGHTPLYDYCLYQKDKKRYGEWMQELAEFVNDERHPGPWQIHCHLGGDRTGVFAATLAALCGADWESIARDYEATTDLLMQQFRHRDLLRYSLKLMLGAYPEEVDNLQLAMRSYMVDNGYITEAGIDSLVARLTTPIEKTYMVVVPVGTRACYMSATWNNWKWTRMDSVDATHFRLTMPDVSEACEYKYSCGTSWDYEDLSTEGKANRTWHEMDTVLAWKATPTTYTPMPQYGTITLKVHSEHAIPYIRWKESGDRCHSSAMRCFTPSAPMAMPAAEDGWYEYTLRDVDLTKGLSYTLQIADQNESEEFVAYADECRNASYALIACKEQPTNLDAVATSSANGIRKIVKDGHLYIMQGAHVYTELGNSIY